MLITERFVMINFPKTGSSFAREAIRQCHWHTPTLRQRIGWRLGRPQRMLKDLLMKPYHFNKAFEERARPVAHGGVCQIPAEHRGKPIVTVVREPLARLVSLYEFRAWAQDPRPSLEEVKAAFPAFPDLSFADYFRMHLGIGYASAAPPGMRATVGPLTLHFIRLFAHDPLRTALALEDGMDLRRVYDQHFPRITFLRTERLNEELYRYLRGMGYPDRAVAFIRRKGKVNATGRSQERYFTPAMLEEYRWRERFFYQLFPDYLKALPAA
jgi:hypothetical protein